MGLDWVECFLTIEEEFSIELHEKDMEEILTVGDLYDYIAAQRRLLDRGQPPDWNRLCAILADQVGLPTSQITRSTRFLDVPDY